MLTQGGTPEGNAVDGEVSVLAASAWAYVLSTGLCKTIQEMFPDCIKNWIVLESLTDISMWLVITAEFVLRMLSSLSSPKVPPQPSSVNNEQPSLFLSSVDTCDATIVSLSFSALGSPNLAHSVAPTEDHFMKGGDCCSPTVVAGQQHHMSKHTTGRSPADCCATSTYRRLRWSCKDWLSSIFSSFAH
eukprot:GHVS01028119.1.p1 GENE.GHVS01028119.1~~GHVS01028119.1.p1  ORF type:complete len:188 (+),score=30.45 GHVS01028119.1:180-743(+)